MADLLEPVVEERAEDMDAADEEEEEDEFPFLKADHPALERVQAALHKHLSGQHDRVTLSVREKSEELKKLALRRQELGTTLYAVQQQLAKLQVELEQRHDVLAAASQGREASEAHLQGFNGKYESKKGEVTTQIKRLQKAQEEVNQLNMTLQQVENFNEQMKAEIQVTRRATYKAEDAIQKIEKDKMKQDFLIDKMNEQIRSLAEMKGLHEAQLAAQKRETEAALATLNEAAREMESIEFEKQQLFQQWNSSLVGMQRRDDALQNIQKALQELEETEFAIESDIRGVHAATRGEQDRNEQLTALLQRNQNEMNHLTTQMQTIKQDRERLAEQYSMLKKSLMHTQKEAAKIDSALSTIEQQGQLVDASIQKVANEATRLTEKIFDIVSEQTTLDRSASNTAKLAKKIHEQIGRKEDELAALSNEIARVKVDALNTRAHNQLLKDRLKQLTDDLADREKLIDQYEMEIRKRHHHIEKKQLFVDRLNKEYDEKRSRQEDESTGPLEAKIKNLRKQIADKSKECGEMQKEWMKKQTELISLQSDASSLAKKVSSQKDETAILRQQKVRQEGTLEHTKKEVRGLQGAEKNLRLELEKLNARGSKHTTQGATLTSQTGLLEKEFMRKLKDKELECTAIEKTIERSKEDRENLQQELVEAEKQLMLWERKIVLEKEMQEALDPNVGQAEVASMKKEIHRMELRLDQLKRRQEQLISDMERVIHKRDVIQLKYEPVQRPGVLKADPHMKATLRRQLNSLRTNLKLATSAIQETENKCGDRTVRLEELQQEVDIAQSETTQFENSANNLNLTVLLQRARRQRNLSEVLKFQRMAKRFEEATTGTAPPKAASSIRDGLAREQQTAVAVQSVLHQLYESAPHLEPLTTFFLEWATQNVDATAPTTAAQPPEQPSEEAPVQDEQTEESPEGPAGEPEAAEAEIAEPAVPEPARADEQEEGGPEEGEGRDEAPAAGEDVPDVHSGDEGVEREGGEPDAAEGEQAETEGQHGE